MFWKLPLHTPPSSHPANSLTHSHNNNHPYPQTSPSPSLSKPQKLISPAPLQVLFFESRSAIQTMQDKFAIYADRFPTWASQSSGMHQFALWAALEAEGLGANLQHYNPLINEKVAATWGVDSDWELNAQLVFGTPSAGPGEKAFQKVEGERFLSFGV